MRAEAQWHFARKKGASMSQIRSRESGYSLPEMLTVIAIIGILALVTVPAFMNFYQSNKMKASMRNFETDLRSIRQLAITNGTQAMLCYGTGPNARSYSWWMGNKPSNSTSWTKYTGTAQHAAKTLDGVVYFPANGAPTPQTFNDLYDCSSGTNCVAGTDGLLDLVFFPDGSIQMPSGSTSGSITIKTDMKIPKPQYTLTISPSGRVLAQ